MYELDDTDGRRPASVTIDVQRSTSGKKVVHVIGELRRGAASVLHRIVAEELRRPPALLALDLSQVACIDGAGVDALVSAAALAGAADISFCLVGTHGGPVGTALAAAEQTEVFEIFASVNEAWAYSR